MNVDHLISRHTARSGFTPDARPVLRIEPGTGETIGFETGDDVYAELYRHGDVEALVAPINPVTGPVYVEGARPGDALKVTVHGIALADHGWSVSLPGTGALSELMGDDLFVRRVPIDEHGVHVTSRHVFEAAPMIGCIGTAPAAGTNSTVVPSYALGGNMDIPQCRPGATIYLPVAVEGGLLSIGDIHALMADGESSFVAIEAAGTAVVSVDVVPQMNLRAPRIETSSEWLFVGLGDPVQESVRRGYEDMFRFLVEDHAWTREDAYAVMSAVGHSQLGGPTGSSHAIDNLDEPRGAVTLHRIAKAVL